MVQELVKLTSVLSKTKSGVSSRKRRANTHESILSSAEFPTDLSVLSCLLVLSSLWSLILSCI